MGKINADWHAKHRMPRNPSDAERVAWHVEHAKHCACREMPAGVRALLKRAGIPPPASKPPKSTRRP